MPNFINYTLLTLCLLAAFLSLYGGFLQYQMAIEEHDSDGRVVNTVGFFFSAAVFLAITIHEVIDIIVKSLNH